MTEQLSGFLPTTLMTGEPEVDAQHEAIFRRVEHLQKLAVESNAVPVAELHELLDYLAEHFATEEQVMAKMGYPHLERHKAQHELLAAKARELNQSSLNGQQPLCCDVTEQLREWMLDHFLGEDRELGLFLQQKSRSS